MLSYDRNLESIWDNSSINHKKACITSFIKEIGVQFAVVFETEVCTIAEVVIISRRPKVASADDLAEMKFVNLPDHLKKMIDICRSGEKIMCL